MKELMSGFTKFIILGGLFEIKTGVIVVKGVVYNVNKRNCRRSVLVHSN